MPKKSTVKVLLHSREQFELVVNNIAHLQIRLQSLEAERAAAIQKVEKLFGPQIDLAAKLIEKSLHDCAAYAAAHRAELFAQDAKTAATATAHFGFRDGQPKLALVAKNTWDKVLVYLRQKWPVLVRTKEETDKEALLAALKTLPPVERVNRLDQLGLRITQAETFWVEAKATDERDSVNVTAK